MKNFSSHLCAWLGLGIFLYGCYNGVTNSIIAGAAIYLASQNALNREDIIDRLQSQINELKER